MRGVLWDLDGTLADSSEFHWQAWREAMDAAGVPITREQFLASFGQRNDAILSRWLGASATPERIRQIGDAKEARYRELIAAAGLQPLPGAAEWVRRLHAEGWRQAIASSAPRLNIESMVAVLGFGDYIDAVVGAEDVRRGKPDPEVFLTAAERIGVPANRCIVVEDAAAGIEAARRGGMRSIGVGAASTLPDDLRVRALDELPVDAFERLLAHQRD
jgi:beta-phosphoglucomutase family hydrolase